MKNYRNAVAASVLALVLSVSAFAGEIHTDVAPPTPPPANGEMHTGATDSVIQTGEAASTPEADAMTETALNLLQSLLSLF
jgi:type IV secretory pathway VirB6-like protein